MPNRGHKEGNQIMRAATAALALALIASAVAPATTRAYSADGFSYTLSGANATVTGCTSTCPADLVIPAALFANPVTSIGAGAFDRENLTSVTIPNTVTEIGAYAFDNCPLPSVSIPNSVVSIGAYAFSGNHLTSVTIPNSVLTINTAAFYSNRLTSVTIGTSVGYIGGDAFAENSLTTITIPSPVQFIGEYAFAGNDLTTVTIPNTVTEIGNHAFDSNALTSVTFLGNAPTAGGGNVFDSNSGLASVTRSYTATGWDSTWSGVAVVIADERAAATVKPTAYGIATVGRTLTARGTWAGYPTPTLRYQWYVCTRAVTAARTTVPSTCKRITGATRSTYKLTSTQRGKYVAVLVTGTSLRTTATTWLSKTTAKVR